MSQYKYVYRIQFLNFDAQTIKIDISPTDILIGDSDPQTIYNLHGTGNPLTISTVNNGQDKFQPIRSKQAIIQFVSDTGIGIDITTFSAGADDLWKVTVTVTDLPETLFQGFLVLADNSQPFQPDPQVVSLTASDHLATIRELPILDYQGNNPLGKYRIADFLTLALSRTGLSLDMYVVNNLRTGSGEYTDQFTFLAPNLIGYLPATAYFYVGQTFTLTGSTLNDGTYSVFAVDGGSITVNETIATELPVTVVITDVISSGHFYNKVFLDSKTFEAEIGKSEDCSTVLEKILGQDCYITQWKGAWWVMRVDEFDGNLIYAAHFDTTGAFIDIAAGTTYNKSIGEIYDIKFANADTLLQFIRPHGYIEEKYNYDPPLETPCNVDFSRGTDILNTVSSSEINYLIDCWIFAEHRSNGYPSVAPVGSAYITKLFNEFLSEKERYITIEKGAGVHNPASLKSEFIPVNQGDKVDISLDYRYDIDFGDLVTTNLGVELVADDGTYYYLVTDLISFAWIEYPGGNGAILFLSNDPGTGIINTEWSTVSTGIVPAMPKTGKLFLYLNQSVPSVTITKVFYANLSFTYYPFINGSNQKYTGQTNKVTRLTTGYFSNQDNQVYISDSPAPLLKGSMFFLSSYSQIYSDTADFLATDEIRVPGYLVDIFRANQYITITATASNNITGKIISVSWLSPSNETQLIVDQTIVNETANPTNIFEANFALTQNYYTAAPLALALNTDPSFLHPYAYIQAFSVWNQFRGTDDADGRGRGINIFTGSLLGLTSFVTWPDLLWKFILADSNENTNDRYFMLISFSQDWRSCIWTATFIEVYSTAVGKVYSDTFTFKYIS